MKNTRATFNTQNIIAILDAAPKGGTIEEVIERAKVDMNATSLNKWIKDGNRDTRNGQTTAYALFVGQWNALYPGKPLRYEAARLAEIKRAFKELGISCENTVAIPSPDARPTKSPKTCDCGNSKKSAAECCESCDSMSHQLAA